MPETFSIALPRDPAASRIAREAVGDRLAEALKPSVVADVTLAVSELVSNAVLHGSGEIELRLEVGTRVVKGEVIDGGCGFERQLAGKQVDGPGLRIVGRLAGKWGVFQGTTHVWFEIPLDPTSDEPTVPTVGRPPAGELPET